ncbi:hypothetical protein [Propioniciclava sp. MC1595]|nr:hypothetical protein [Propioniciclava sp. MC1595]
MKSALASIIAGVVLATGVPVLAVQQQALPPWFCKLLPPLCSRN